MDNARSTARSSKTIRYPRLRAFAIRSSTGSKLERPRSSPSKACANGSSAKRARIRSASCRSINAISCASWISSACSSSIRNSVSDCAFRASRSPSSLSNNRRSSIISRNSDCMMVDFRSESRIRPRSSSIKRRCACASASNSTSSARWLSIRRSTSSNSP